MTLKDYSETYVPKYPNFVEITKKHESVHWTEDEPKMSVDVEQWKQGAATPAEKALIANILRLFTTSDVVVGQAYFERLIPVIKNNEARNMLGSFAARECFDGETELLTSEGWRQIDSVTEDDLVAQYDPRNGAITFANPTKVMSYDYDGIMHHYESSGMDLFVTPEHRLAVIDPASGDMELHPSAWVDWSRGFLAATSGTSSTYDVRGDSSGFTRLLATAHASGSAKVSSDGVCTMYVGSKSGRDRLIQLTSQHPEMGDLSDWLVEGIYGTSEFGVSFKVPEGVDAQSIETLDCFDLPTMSRYTADTVLDVLKGWADSVGFDGHSYTYHTAGKKTADNISAIAAIGGHRSVVDENADGTYSVTLEQSTKVAYPKRNDVEFSGKVYCVSVPQTTVVARRNGKVVVSGNSIHQRAYALLSDTLGFGDEFYNEFLEYSEMVEKYEYMVEAVEPTDKGFASYLVKQTLIEGVNLFASFAVLLNFDRLGKFPGMCDVVRWSMVDESIHVEGNSLLFREFLNENPEVVDDDFKKGVYDSARELVRLEDLFIEKAFEMGGVSNLTEEDVKSYIRYVADYRLNQLGFKKNWDIKENPLPWIDYLMGKTFGNFFEREVVEYSKGNLTGQFKAGY